MKLTREKALEICIELWTWLAKTGQRKKSWDGWEIYRAMRYHCPFCEYSDILVRGDSNCRAECPIQKHYKSDCCQGDLGYYNWTDAKTKRTRRKYAKIFLERLLEIK